MTDREASSNSDWSTGYWEDEPGPEEESKWEMRVLDEGVDECEDDLWKGEIYLGEFNVYEYLLPSGEVARWDAGSGVWLRNEDAEAETRL